MGIGSGIMNAIGHVAVGGAKIAGGAALQSINLGLKGAEVIGRGVIPASEAIGRGTLGLANNVGRSVVRPFEKEYRENTIRNYGDVLGSIGNVFVTKDDKGEMKLTNKGLIMAGALITAGNLRGRYFDEKAENMGTPDTKATRMTPNYNPIQYEMHPPKRISADSGGATGDLVFALHKMR